jgi:hypothetical protein
VEATRGGRLRVETSTPSNLTPFGEAEIESYGMPGASAGPGGFIVFNGPEGAVAPADPTESPG